MKSWLLALLCAPSVLAAPASPQALPLDEIQEMLALSQLGHGCSAEGAITTDAAGQRTLTLAINQGSLHLRTNLAEHLGAEVHWSLKKGLQFTGVPYWHFLLVNPPPNRLADGEVASWSWDVSGDSRTTTAFQLAVADHNQPSGLAAVDCTP